MYVSELEFLFRHQADDVVDEPYKTDEASFLFFLNEAQRKAARNANLIHDKTSSFTRITITAGQSKYMLDASIYAITGALLTQADGTIIQLASTDSAWLDRESPKWREQVGRPGYFIHGRSEIEITPTPDAACTLQLEVYRYPDKLESGNDEPEIDEEHHEHLIDWVLYRAGMSKYADTTDRQKALIDKENFLAYFGHEPRANTRKEQNSNKPHRNRAVI